MYPTLKASIANRFILPQEAIQAEVARQLAGFDQRALRPRTLRSSV